ncbi:Uncharacterised protein [Xylophilus ampelinus]|nr:Uncharacterised protein [Xylophilus ampelinus]
MAAEAQREQHGVRRGVDLTHRALGLFKAQAPAPFRLMRVLREPCGFYGSVTQWHGASTRNYRA